MTGYHRSVMLREVVEWLAPRPGFVVLDLTVGGGGHAEAILDRLRGQGSLMGVDRDAEAVREAEARLSGRPGVRVVKGSFGELGALLDSAGMGKFDGVLFDLGVSSRQLDAPFRGFSFRGEGALDMRMDRSQSLTAADLLSAASEEQLVQWIRDYGEERFARRIARGIVRERGVSPLETTTQLADLIRRVVPGSASHGRIHPATRTFQALRMVVNRELESLESALHEVVSRLVCGGRVVVLSYHSLEDRLVKKIFRGYTGRCVCPREFPVCRCNPVKVLKVLTGKPVRPSQEEIEQNPRSRSARLRAAERVAA